MGSLKNFVARVDSRQDAKAKAGDLAGTLAGMAREQYNLYGPQRQSIADMGQKYLEGNYDYAESPVYDATKMAAERAYGQARDTVLANVAPGGTQARALTDIAGNRAQTMTNVGAAISQEMMNLINQNANLTAQTGMSGTGQAGGMYSTLAGLDLSEYAAQMQKKAQEDASKAQGFGGFGQAVGMGLAGKKK